MIPQGSKYPEQFDNEKNLFTAHDSLQVTLNRDHYIGENFVFVNGDTSKFPEQGIITLTDQCSNPEDRAVSFYYSKKTKEGFFDLELLPESRDVSKPKKLTTISQQVMAEYHESIKNSIIAIEGLLGTRNTVDTQPNGSTIFGRINFLRNLLYSPKAWFESNTTLGLSPLTVKFKFTGAGKNVLCNWDFGDGNTDQTTESEIVKTYYVPGVYDVSLTVTNIFGTDEITFQKMIHVKAEAPEEAVIKFDPSSYQIVDEQNKLRTPVNEAIYLEIPQGINLEDTKKLYSGELVDESHQPLNPIIKYSWKLGDDLPHDNLPKTIASYSIGGLYDLIIRADTKYGTYRTTIFPKCIDVVENINLWLWTSNENNVFTSHEFGLICETFKTNKNIPLLVTRNNDFLHSERAKKEFNFNNGFAPKNPSSQRGSVLLFWASAEDKIDFVDYDAFLDLYDLKIEPISRPWNWASLISPNTIYFILGNTGSMPLPTMSPTNQTKSLLNIGDGFIKNEPLTYLNGAHELGKNAVSYDESGEPKEGHFSTYRTAWKEQTGYLLRNNEQGSLSNFYKTEGTIGYPFINLTKLVNMPNLNNRDGQLVPLSEGVYCFGSTGSVSAYKEATGTWEVGPQANINGEFILAASDGDKRAYLTTKDKLIKFNEADLTFTTVASIPGSEQWLMGVY